ncbi:hypothetical protein ACFY4C_31205 [Actinomadura viridis]|uniref:hypothetical protein n=1 Tax=Actinomadura viridis TaxID=58110 RepID=UPI0036A9303F
MYLKDDGTLDHQALSRELRGIVSDRPARDPCEVLLWLAARLRADPAGPDGPALTLAVHATSCYAIWRIRRVEVVDALIEAAARAAEAYGALGCPASSGRPHPAAHPGAGTSGDDPETVAGVIGLIGAARDGGGARGELEAWCCPGFLAGLAGAALTTLRNGRRARFEASDTANLDAHFLAGGRADIARLTRTAERHRPGDPSDLAEQAGLWAARRLLSGAAPAGERLPLLLTVCFAAQHCHWCATSPARVAVYRAALAAVDPEPLERPCPHSGGHPDVPVRSLLRYARALAGHGGDGLRVDEDAWRCPRHMAERAASMLAHTAGYLGLDHSLHSTR